jgi:hypothetical protein
LKTEEEAEYQRIVAAGFQSIGVTEDLQPLLYGVCAYPLDGFQSIGVTKDWRRPLVFGLAMGCRHLSF